MGLYDGGRQPFEDVLGYLAKVGTPYQVARSQHMSAVENKMRFPVFLQPMLWDLSALMTDLGYAEDHWLLAGVALVCFEFTLVLDLPQSWHANIRKTPAQSTINDQFTFQALPLSSLEGISCHDLVMFLSVSLSSLRQCPYSENLCIPMPGVEFQSTTLSLSTYMRGVEGRRSAGNLWIFVVLQG